MCKLGDMGALQGTRMQIRSAHALPPPLFGHNRSINEIGQPKVAMSSSESHYTAIGFDSSVMNIVVNGMRALVFHVKAERSTYSQPAVCTRLKGSSRAWTDFPTIPVAKPFRTPKRTRSAKRPGRSTYLPGAIGPNETSSVRQQYSHDHSRLGLLPGTLSRR